MKRMKKLFTLIELIVVIVVLGILAAIVIPNISSFKEEAKETAILSDARNIQTAVDMFMLEKDGKTPTNEKATLGNPQIVELYGLKPEYLRDTPKDNGAKFWLDENNTVWASMVDAPTNVNYEDGTLTWDTVDGAKLYKIYKTEDAATASAKGSLKLDFIENVIPLNDSTPSKTLPVLTKGTYLVTAIDTFNFESAPTKVNTNYEGYKEGPNKDFTVDVPLNKKPLAVIGVNPETNINTGTTIVWSYSGSSDPENDTIKTAEWKIDGVIKDSMPEKLPEGTFNIEIRVQDEKGAWSDWVSKKIVVEKYIAVTYTFTNANKTGKFGPSQENLNVAYLNTSLENKVTSLNGNGIQLWTIPVTGKYKIEAYGSQGGGTEYSGYASRYGGKGAILKGEFNLIQGTVLKILIGQKGTTHATSANGGGGGGGGTFIAKLDNTPLLVAGGGGGATALYQHPTSNYSGKDATITNNGTNAGVSGSYSPTGGASFNQSTTGTNSFIAGGNGGNANYLGHGGFGGGAGSISHPGGGGGGYSGGNGGFNHSPNVATGGGSFNAGTSQENSIGNTEHGKAIITYLGQ